VRPKWPVNKNSRQSIKPDDCQSLANELGIHKNLAKQEKVLSNNLANELGIFGNLANILPNLVKMPTGTQLGIGVSRSADPSPPRTKRSFLLLPIAPLSRVKPGPPQSLFFPFARAETPSVPVAGRSSFPSHEHKPHLRRWLAVLPSIPLR